MNKIYWVFGCTASGKEMFIKNAVTKYNEIISLFDWKDKTIIPVYESILYVGRYHKDPIVEKRTKIISKVMQIAKENKNAVILIKGQNVDFEMNLINILRDLLPDLEHEIIFLYADLNVIFERGKQRIWYDKKDNDINKWRDRIMNAIELVEKKLGDYKITAINTTNGYIPMLFPEFAKSSKKSK